MFQVICFMISVGVMSAQCFGISLEGPLNFDQRDDEAAVLEIHVNVVSDSGKKVSGAIAWLAFEGNGNYSDNSGRLLFSTPKKILVDGILRIDLDELQIATSSSSDAILFVVAERGIYGALRLERLTSGLDLEICVVDTRHRYKIDNGQGALHHARCLVPTKIHGHSLPPQVIRMGLFDVKVENQYLDSPFDLGVAAGLVPKEQFPHRTISYDTSLCIRGKGDGGDLTFSFPTLYTVKFSKSKIWKTLGTNFKLKLVSGTLGAPGRNEVEVRRESVLSGGVLRVPVHDVEDGLRVLVTSAAQSDRALLAEVSKGVESNTILIDLGPISTNPCRVLYQERQSAWFDSLSYQYSITKEIESCKPLWVVSSFSQSGEIGPKRPRTTILASLEDSSYVRFDPLLDGRKYGLSSRFAAMNYSKIVEVKGELQVRPPNFEAPKHESAVSLKIIVRDKEMVPVRGSRAEVTFIDGHRVIQFTDRSGRVTVRIPEGAVLNVSDGRISKTYESTMLQMKVLRVVL